MKTAKYNHYCKIDSNFKVGFMHQCHIPCFLEISPQQDFISRLRLVHRQFEGGVYRDRHACAYTASIIMYAGKMPVRIRKLLLTPYHVARFRGRRLLGQVGRYIDVATFPGQRDFEVRRDFEEIRYLIPITFKWWSLAVLSSDFPRGIEQPNLAPKGVFALGSSARKRSTSL